MIKHISHGTLFLSLASAAVISLLIFIFVITQASVSKQFHSSNIYAGAQGASISPGNSLQNPSFENSGATWFTPWTLTTAKEAHAVITKDTTTSYDGRASALITISKTGASPSNIQLKQSKIGITQNSPVNLSFAAKAEEAMVLFVSMQLSDNPHTEYFNQSVALTNTWQRYTLLFTPPATAHDTTLIFHLGSQQGKIWIDAVSM